MSFDYFMSILKPMLEGAQMTVLLFFIAIVVSIPLGFILTLAVKSRFKPLSWLAQGYIYVMRGTPLLLQLLFICFRAADASSSWRIFSFRSLCRCLFRLYFELCCLFCGNFPRRASWPLIKVNMRHPKCSV